VHLVSFIIRIYHDARLLERQTWLQLAQNCPNQLGIRIRGPTVLHISTTRQKLNY